MINYIISTPPGTYLPAQRIENLLNNANAGKIIICACCPPERTKSMLENLSANDRRISLKPGATEEDSPSLLTAAINESLESSPEGLTVFVDGRAEINCADLNVLIAPMVESRATPFALLCHKTAPSAPFHLLMEMLLYPGYPTVAAIRNDFLKNNKFQPDSSLHFFTLPELMLNMATECMPSPLPATMVSRFPAGAGRTSRNFEQRIMDEENNTLERYQKLFFEQGFSNIPPQEIAAEYKTRVNKVMKLFEKLKQGILESVEEYDRCIFRYCLLALYSGDIDNARQMFETSFSIIGERPALMRLYKQLVLNFPLDPHPVSGPQKVSVVVPLFNQGHYLEEAVMSVVRQTYTNWEMYIINDGSTDNTAEVAEELVARINDSRVTLIHQENRGKGGTRNRGIRETDGEFVVTLDSDDAITPDYFAVAVRLMDENPRVGWVTPKTLVFGKDNHVAWGDEYNFARSIMISPSPSSSLLRRCALEELGLYREDLTNREDAELWISLVEAGWTSIPTESPLFLYRHACRRPGLNNVSNIPSKEEITSLHPWWFRLDLDEKLREKAYTEFTVYRFPEWFLNWENIKRAMDNFADRDAFVEVINSLKKEYPPITKPRRWQTENDDCYIEIRENLYGVRSRK